MCLGIPGKVVRWIETEGPFARADVEFAGVTRECAMACVPEAALGDFVLVHAGIAIGKLDERQAQELLDALATLEVVEEWHNGHDDADSLHREHPAS